MGNPVRKTDIDVLKMKIDLPAFQLELVTKEPLKALGEIRRILESVQVDDDAVYEEYAIQEFRSTFSQGFIENPQVLESVRQLLKQEEDYIVAKAVIPTTAEIDVDNSTGKTGIARSDVKQAIARMVRDVDVKAVRQGIVHVSGQIPPEDRLLILDHIHTRMPTARLRAFQSKDAKSGVAVECIFFGEFPDEEES